MGSPVMDRPASVILHVPERYGAMLEKARRPLLYGVIRDLVRAGGGAGGAGTARHRTG